MSRVQGWDAREQIVPRHDQLERELRMHFLVARGHVLNRRDDRLKLFFRFLELLVRSYDLLERRDLLFRLSRMVESGK